MQTYAALVNSSTTMGELYNVINANFQVVISNFSGTAFPTPQGPGHPCFRTDRGVAGVMYLYTSDTSVGENGWVDIVSASPYFVALDEEVEAARGTAASLAARLDVAINPDGSLKGDAPVGDWWENVADFTYVDSTSFTVAGDVTALFEDGMGLQITLVDASYAYTRVDGDPVYDDENELTTVAVVDEVLTSDMTKIERGQHSANSPLISYSRDQVDALIDAVSQPRSTVVTTQDWDTLVENGIYKVVGASGDHAASTTVTSGVLIVGTVGTYMFQEFVTATRRWSRQYLTSWGAWYEQATDPTTIDSRLDDLEADVEAHETAIGNLGTAATGDIGVDVQAYDADILKADTTDNLVVGFTSDVYAHGNINSGYTVSLTEECLQTITINQNAALAPPSTGNGCVVLIATNDSTGGHALTTGGFTAVNGEYDNTANKVHRFVVTKVGPMSILDITEVS